MSYERKTERSYGVIYGLIRTVAARRKRFTVEALMPPLTLRQARDNCQRLLDRGELRRIRVGLGGRFSFRRTVYSRTTLE
jgi:hypothetical protein